MSDTFKSPQQPLLPPRPEQGRALLTVLTVMTILATLALLFSRGADRLSDRWTAQLTQSSTIQLMISSEELRQTQMERSVEILQTTLPNATISPLSKTEAQALLRPWLGSINLPDDLPVPGVIRVDMTGQLPLPSLNRQFEEAGLRIVIDDHSRFSGRLKQTVGRLVLLGTVLVGLTLIAALAVSAFATRAGLSAQRDIIHVLVQVGASDFFIARLFIGQAMKRGFLGALLGSILAVCIWLMISFGPGRGSVGWRSFGDASFDLLALCLLIAAFAMICAFAAGWAATRQLSEERRRA